jgi:DNA-binding PadR family transcriptional regulator
MEQHLPLTEATFFILLSLVPGAKHGYAILKEVDELSAGRVRLSTSTLYGALDRLLNQGWIARVDDEPTDRRGQKSYQLTELGKQIFQAETERMAALVTASQRRLREAE